MNCPVCQRALASTISVCFSCGTMVNDSVREELEIKIGPVVKIIPNVSRNNVERREKFSMSARQNTPIVENQPLKTEPSPLKFGNVPVNAECVSVKTETISNTSGKPTQTGEINVRTTAPTLVEFQSKKAALPDWRLKIQNAVQQRKGSVSSANIAAAVQSVAAPAQKPRYITNGANALKTDVIEETAPVDRDERMERVLKRIENSRHTFLVKEIDEEETILEIPAPDKNFPLKLAQKNPEIAGQTAVPKAKINAPAKPKLVSSMRNANGDFDTNKLPPISAIGTVVVDLDSLPTVSSPKIEVKQEEVETKPVREIRHLQFETAENNEIIQTETEIETEEIDDLAPFALRFNSGVFDLILGSFVSLMMIAPFMLNGGEWFSFKGFLAFTVVCSVVMFLYLTTSVAFYGRTLGMKVFSLELIDIEENAYPTLHQAAVNSAVYIVSLIFGGIGFLTVPFNEEKRAVHDLVSGTIVVKE